MVTVNLSEDKKNRLIERTQKMLEATVDDVMRVEGLLTVDAGDLVARAARIILENGILGLLVLKDGKAYRMLTTFDLLKLSYDEAFDESRDYFRMRVGDLVADKELISVPPGTRLRECLNIMLEARLRTIPVIEEGEVRGILSLVDLVTWYRNTHDEVRTGRI